MSEPNNDPRKDETAAGSPHLDEAIKAFRQGLNALGLFCTEQALPAAGKSVKAGLANIKELADELGKTLDEAIKKARERFSDKDDNSPNKPGDQ